MFSRFPPFPFALLVTLFMPWCAFAQTSSNSTAVTVNKEDAPQKVEITGKYEERRHDTASKIVVNRDEFLRFGDSNVSDVLKRLPGISSNGGQIRFRGLGNGYTQVLLNGEQTPPGFQIDSLSPDLIEKIEILEAPVTEK